jgi:hypothetical protein
MKDKPVAKSTGMRTPEQSLKRSAPKPSGDQSQTHMNSNLKSYFFFS